MGMYLVDSSTMILRLVNETIMQIRGELSIQRIITNIDQAKFLGRDSMKLISTNAVRGTGSRAQLGFPMWIEIMPQIIEFKRQPFVSLTFALRVFMFEPRSMRLFWYPKQGRIPEAIHKVAPDNVYRFLAEEEAKARDLGLILNSFYHLKQKELIQKVVNDMETVYVLTTWFIHYSTIFDRPIAEFDCDQDGCVPKILIAPGLTNVPVMSFLTKEQAMLARPIYVELAKKNKVLKIKKIGENKKTFTMTFRSLNKSKLAGLMRPLRAPWGSEDWISQPEEDLNLEAQLAQIEIGAHGGIVTSTPPRFPVRSEEMVVREISQDAIEPRIRRYTARLNNYSSTSLSGSSGSSGSSGADG